MSKILPVEATEIVDGDAQIKAFNYSLLNEDDAIEARAAAARIKVRLRHIAEDTIETGKDLIETREKLGYGHFVSWIKAEFNMSHATAYRIIGVAEQYGDTFLTGEKSFNVTTNALYLLAAKSTPAEVKAEVDKMIETGDVVKKADVVKRIEIHEKEQARIRAERDKALQDVSELQKKNEELANTPPAPELDLDEAKAELSHKAAVEIQANADRIKKDFEEQIKNLTAEIAALKKAEQKSNVLQFEKNLTPAQEAEIDAVGDEYADANYNKTADDEGRAGTVAGAIRAIATINAKPKAVMTYFTKGKTKNVIAENMEMIEKAFKTLEAVKGLIK